MSNRFLVFLSYFTLALVITVMAVIFTLSAQDRETSTKTSNKVVDVVIDVTEPDIDKKPPKEQKRIREKISHTVRKSAHAAEYAVLGVLMVAHAAAAGAAYGETGKRFMGFRIRKKELNVLKLLIAVLILVIYALSDELHQSFVDGRGPGWPDVLIDSAGGIAGMIVTALIWFAVTAKKRRKNTKKSRA